MSESLPLVGHKGIVHPPFVVFIGKEAHLLTFAEILPNAFALPGFDNDLLPCRWQPLIPSFFLHAIWNFQIGLAFLSGVNAWKRHLLMTGANFTDVVLFAHLLILSAFRHITVHNHIA